MGQVRLALGVVAALVGAMGEDAHARPPTEPRAPDRAMTATMAPPMRDPDAEVPYVPPRRVIAPPVYGNPGPPLNPGGVPYDDLFASPYPFDIPDSFLRPDDPYLD